MQLFLVEPNITILAETVGVGLKSGRPRPSTNYAEKHRQWMGWPRA
jgi:hypothetical protein